MFLDPVGPVLDHDVVVKALDPCHLLYFGIVFEHCYAEGFGREDGGQLGIVEIDVIVDAIDAVGIDIEPVVAELVGDVEDDEEADAEAGGEADDVDGGESFGFP
jgi:hypothetical protein